MISLLGCWISLAPPAAREDIEEKYYADKEDAYDMRKTWLDLLKP